MSERVMKDVLIVSLYILSLGLIQLKYTLSCYQTNRGVTLYVNGL